MTKCRLFIDADGDYAGTYVLVLGEDGSCLGELEGVRALTYEVDKVRQHARAELTVLKVPGRFLADNILINELGPAKKRRWWKR